MILIIFRSGNDTRCGLYFPTLRSNSRLSSSASRTAGISPIISALSQVQQTLEHVEVAIPGSIPSSRPCDTVRTSNRKPCIVAGCQELLASTMWRNHMTLHARVLFPGAVPNFWLEEQDLHCCASCHQLVANSRSYSHSQRCKGRAPLTSNIMDTPSMISGGQNQPNTSLPSFEEVCQLTLPTIRFITKISRPSFARVLSATLRQVVLENSELAWLKLFMLPKCVLPLSKRRGCHDVPASVNFLCDLWSNNDFGTLWNLAKGNHRHNHQPHDQAARDNQDLVAYAVSLGRAGLFGKACRALESKGLAPNNDATWQLLQSKHPSCPPPAAPSSSAQPIFIGPDFDILSIVCSFPKGTAASPSGLRIQQLLGAALIPLPTSICATLKDTINLLAAGKAPPLVSRFLAGGRLIALNKLKDGSLPDIRPIAVGESLRRLTGKCICALVKNKASDLFQPLQLGVSCSSGSEKIVQGLRMSIEKHWMEDLRGLQNRYAQCF